MTIEGLKATFDDAYKTGEALAPMRWEILALVEAVSFEAKTYTVSASVRAALDAFNAKLAEL